MPPPSTNTRNEKSTDAAAGKRFSRFAFAAVALLFVPAAWWALMISPHFVHNAGIDSPARRMLVLLAAIYFLLWTIYFALSRRGRKEKSINFTLCSASIIFCVMLAELLVVFGVADYRKIFGNQENGLVEGVNNSWNRQDPELIHIHQPNIKYKGEIAGDLVPWLGIAADRRYPVDVAYDSRGFRNDRELSRADIVLIGDSFIESVLTPTPKLLSTRLEENFKRPVANLGQSGYGPQQELAVLRRFGLPLEPKAVFWFFFEGNDLYDVGDYEETLAAVRAGKSDASSLKDRSFIVNFPHALERVIAANRRRDSVDAENQSCRLKNPLRFRDERMYFAYAVKPLVEWEFAALEKARRIIQQARDLSESRGARFVLVFIPAKFRVFKNVCEIPKDAFIENWTLNDLPEDTRKWADENDIEHLDMTKPLVAATEDGRMTFFLDDGHWNEEGNAVAFETISNYLSQTGAIESP